MPTFPSSTPIDTHDRMRTENDLQRRFLSPSVVINPMFQHIAWRQAATYFDFGNWNPIWLRLAPGWFPFGSTAGGAGQDLLIDTGQSVDDSPIRLGSGFELQQQQGRIGGMVQEIANAEILRGRRVRISGSYRLPQASPTADAGISIWWKGKKQTVNRLFSDWNVGGIGYNSIDLSTTLDLMHVLEMKAGLTQPWSGSPSIHIPCYDELRDFGPRELTLRGADNPSGEGSATRHDVSIWYLDDSFSNGTSDGTIRLHAETQGTQGVYYFEAYVDIPDDDNYFEDNIAHLVVMPVDPSNVGGMTVAAQIRLYAINIEAVLDDASTEDRVLNGCLRPHMHSPGYGDGAFGLNVRYLLRNPIYVPNLHPLFSGFPRMQDGMTGTTTNGFDDPPAGLVSMLSNDPWFSVGNDPRTHVGFARSFVIGSFLTEHFGLVPVPHLPPGSSIVKVGLTTDIVFDTNTLGYKDVYIVEAASFVPTGDVPFDDNDNARVVVQLQGNTFITGAGTTTTHLKAARRNRVGLYWSDKSDNGMSGNDILGVSEHFLIAHVEDEVALKFGGGWLLAVSDPRLAGSAFQAEP